MNGTNFKRRGNTLPELIVALGILAIIFSIATISLLGSQRSSAQSASIGTIIIDMREQQTKAMSQDTSGDSASSDYGIFFGETSYTLFKGSTYNSSDPSNFVIPLDVSLKLSDVTFSGSMIVFKAGSGEVNGFTEGSNTFKVEDLTNSQTKTITVNSYGVPFE